MSGTFEFVDARDNVIDFFLNDREQRQEIINRIARIATLRRCKPNSNVPLLIGIGNYTVTEVNLLDGLLRVYDGEVRPVSDAIVGGEQ